MRGEGGRNFMYIFVMPHFCVVVKLPSVMRCCQDSQYIQVILTIFMDSNDQSELSCIFLSAKLYIPFRAMISFFICFYLLCPFLKHFEFARTQIF